MQSKMSKISASRKIVPVLTARSTTRPSAAHGSSCRPLASIDIENNNIPASIISKMCIQISKEMYEASDSLNEDKLQELSTEIAKYAVDSIKRKKQSTESNKQEEDIFSIDSSVQKAINKRMASVVEKRGKSLALSEPSQVGEINVRNDENQYDEFLNICATNLLTNQQQVRCDFIKFKRSDINIPFLCFAVVSTIFFVITGLFFPSDVRTFSHYPTLLPALFFAVLTAISLLWVALNRLAYLSFRYDIVCLQWYHQYVIKLYDSSYGQWPDNLAVVCAALSTGLYLINIVIMDICDPEKMVNVGRSRQDCYAFVEPPTEWWLLTMLAILILQFFARGVSRIALVVSWFICLFAVNTSIYLSDSGNYVWMNILQFFIIFISYEVERQPLFMYLKTLKAIEVSELTAKLNARLLAMENLQAAEALKAKCSLVRHIGHEIRTPLNVVGVGIDMLMKELEKCASTLPDNIIEIVNDVKEASSASLEVINELLMFEKLAAGLTTLECVPTPIIPFLEQAMKQHLLPARAKKILFELVPSSSVTRNVTIDVDPIKLITVFRNLFSNAIKFTKKDGQITVHVEIKHPSPCEDEVVEVRVQDTGAGLSAANLGKLFGEGVQFNANGLQGGGGSGLGLFITKGIVNLHNHGKIWAESEGEGFGCTFFVQFPLHSHHYVVTLADSSSHGGSERPPMRIETQLVISPRSTPVLSVVESTWKPIILVVDDSPMNRKMLVRMLIANGFACREAEDGMEGLSEISRWQTYQKSNCGSPAPRSNCISRKTPGPRFSLTQIYPQKTNQKNSAYNFEVDAVLIDSNMPRMNGPDAIVEMRKIGFRGPIIGVSGGDTKTMKEFLKAGANNVLQKPVQSDQLMKMLLFGLELIVKEAMLLRPHESSFLDDNVVLVPENSWEERIQRLHQFIEKANNTDTTNK